MDDYLCRETLRGWIITDLRRTPVAMIDKQGNSFGGWTGNKFAREEGQKYATLNDFLKVFKLHTFKDVKFKKEAE